MPRPQPSLATLDRNALGDFVFSFIGDTTIYKISKNMKWSDVSLMSWFSKGGSPITKIDALIDIIGYICNRTGEDPDLLLFLAMRTNQKYNNLTKNYREQ